MRRLFKLLLTFSLIIGLVGLSADATAVFLRSYPGLPDGWFGDAVHNDRTADFEECAGTRAPQSATTVSIMVSRQYQWRLLITNHTWDLRGGERSVAIKIDGEAWLQGKALVVDPTQMWVRIDWGLLPALRRGQKLDIGGISGQTVFDLTSSSRTVQALAECVQKHTGYRAPPHLAALLGPPSRPAAPEGSSQGGKGGSAPAAPALASGSGIVVSESGYVLTNHHVIDQCITLTVTQSGGIAGPAELIRSNPSNDLAIIKVEGTFAAADTATFRSGAVQAGETVAVYGFPLASMLSRSGNITSGNVTALSGIGDDVRYLQISAPIQPGNSGGPVMDAGGLILGVVNAKINEAAVLEAVGSLPQNINFAIKGNVATTFLDAHSIPYAAAAAADGLSLVDIAAKAKRFGVYIECQLGPE